MNSETFIEANPTITWGKASRILKAHGQTLDTFLADNPTCSVTITTQTLFDWLGY